MNSDIRTLMEMMEEGISPKLLLSHLAPSYRIPPDADDMMLWRFVVSMIDPPRRKKLSQFNTIKDAIDLIKKSEKIIVLSGAGISTSAGLPDFRSRNGIYVQIHNEHPDLTDPKSMFDIEYFRQNPLPFYQFAKALYPGQYQPTIGHKFIKCIEHHNKLLRNYTQNIDTLEKQAGISRVIECHGSFAKATCTNCKFSVDCDVIKDDVLSQKVPLCPKCSSSDNGPEDGLGVMKPNIVFFGEQLGDEFHSSLETDKEQADLLIVIGSSLKVRPVALIPKSIPPNVPQILINKEPLDHQSFDIELLGNSDDIIQELCSRLGEEWVNLCQTKAISLNEIIGVPSANNLEDDSLDSDETIQDVDNETTQEHDSTANNTSEQGCAISNDDQVSNEEDWEDVESLDSHDSTDNPKRTKADICIPDSSYVFLKPNRYIFRGAELTVAQLESFTKE